MGSQPNPRVKRSKTVRFYNLATFAHVIVLKMFLSILCSYFVRRNARRPISRVLSLQAGDDHSSGTPVARRLKQPTRATTRKHRCRLPGVSPLFGLAPGGVCHAASVAGRAVSSYPTVSPLPSWRTRQAVCFLWHFPWGRPRRVLPGTVFPWSPDFPPLGANRRAAIRPSGLYKLSAMARRVNR